MLNLLTRRGIYISFKLHFRSFSIYLYLHDCMYTCTISDEINMFKLLRKCCLCALFLFWTIYLSTALARIAHNTVNDPEMTNSLVRHISMYPGKYLYSTNIINPPIVKSTVQINRNPFYRVLFSSFTLGSETNRVLVSAGCGKSDPSISIGIVCSLSASSNAPSKFLLAVGVCLFRWGNTSVPPRRFNNTLLRDTRG